MVQVCFIWFVTYTANPTWGDVFDCCFKARSSKLEGLFSLKRGKRDVRALSFELSKMSQPPQPFPPILASMFYVIYLTTDSTAQCVCSPGAGFKPPEFLSPCGLPVSCCLATSVVRSRNSDRLVAPPCVYVCIGMDSAVPAWSSSLWFWEA